jgi:hypothetical protein
VWPLWWEQAILGMETIKADLTLRELDGELVKVPVFFYGQIYETHGQQSSKTLSTSPKALSNIVNKTWSTIVNKYVHTSRRLLDIVGCSTSSVTQHRRLLNIVGDSTSSTLSTIEIRRLIEKFQDY